MAYTPTTWVENATTLGPTNMNHLEAGVQAAAAVADSATAAAAAAAASATAAATTANAAVPKPASIAAGETAVWSGSAWVRSSSTTLGLSSLPDPGTGKVIGSVGSGAVAVTPIGTEVAYAQFTSSVSVASTTEATGTSVVTAPAFTADGVSAYLIEFFSPAVSAPTNAAGNTTIITAFEGATQLGRMALVQQPTTTATMFVPVRASLKVTPSAGAHTYSINAHSNSLTGAPSVTGGSGGTSGYVPGYVRITKAS